MKPRWLVALAILTAPVWFIPVMIYAGWHHEGRYGAAELPKAIRYIFTGKIKP